MGGRLGGWLALSWTDRGRLLLMMLLGLPTIAAAVRLFGYGRTQRWLERRSNFGKMRAATFAELEDAARLARLAAIAGRHGPITATCLRQSLLVYWLLRRRGLRPEFRIGVRKHGELMDAHAWVELDGRGLDAMQVSHRPFPVPR